jgi:solute:Na+ symporter, SSS family
VIAWISLGEFLPDAIKPSFTLHKNLAIVFGTMAIFMVGFFAKLYLSIQAQN